MRCPLGKDPLTVAFAKAHDEPIHLLDEHCFSDKFELFISVAYHLQMAKDGPILFCERFAELLDTSVGTISNYRRIGVQFGFMIEVSPHQHRKGDKGKATEFRFAADRINPGGTRGTSDVSTATEGGKYSGATWC